ncbi:helix-turn-helix domain-containing protein [Solibacillus sp. FSL R7-0682]|uniref:helix-turn-helix domain-containing protein n=1 Tax=Bacillales TaxID=1385 RepID=UPI0030F59D71
MKTGKFMHYANAAKQRKEKALDVGKNGMIPHDLWRRFIPIAMEYDRGNADMALLYSYLIAKVNGQPDNDRYMSAFPSVDRIAEDTRISRNRIAKLSNALEACGLLVTAYDYAANRREKLYYPQYYSELTDAEVRANFDKLTS